MKTVGIEATSYARVIMGITANADAKTHYFASDMLSWPGVILAALVVVFTGWTLSDPIFGAGIGVFIAPRTSYWTTYATNAWRLQSPRLLRRYRPGLRAITP